MPVPRTSIRRFAGILLAIVLAAAACNGPIYTDEPPPAPPAGLSSENASLSPRRNPLSVGAVIPDFSLTDQKGNSVSAMELTSGKGAVVLFLPEDSNPAARPAYTWARKSRGFLASRGLELLFVTPHSVEQNAGIAGREDLPMAFLSDPASWVAGAFGVAPKGRPSSIHAFVFGSNGRVQLSEQGLPDPAMIVMAAESLPGQSSESSFFLP